MHARQDLPWQLISLSAYTEGEYGKGRGFKARLLKWHLNKGTAVGAASCWIDAGCGEVSEMWIHYVRWEAGIWQWYGLQDTGLTCKSPLSLTVWQHICFSKCPYEPLCLQKYMIKKCWDVKWEVILHQNFEKWNFGNYVEKHKLVEQKHLHLQNQNGWIENSV